MNAFWTLVLFITFIALFIFSFTSSIIFIVKGVKEQFKCSYGVDSIFTGLSLLIVSLLLLFSLMFFI